MTNHVVRAAVLRSATDPYAIETLTLPPLERGEVLVKVVGAGLCHTDLLPRAGGRWGTPPIVLCHVSHIYPTGASLYFTVAARQADDPLTQWADAKAAASSAMVEAGATITHHHAVGRDHRDWLECEIGPVGVEILRAVKDRLDPAGVLNPGVLIPQTGQSQSTG